MRRAVWLVAFVLAGCGGDPFEPGSFPDSSLAGAQSSAGAQAVGSSAGLSGVAGEDAGGAPGELGGAAGSPEIPEAPGGAGGAVQGGGGSGGSGGVPSVPFPCNVKAWKASAFASSPTQPASLAVDVDAASRWSSGQSREIGQWFALELGAGVVLESLELRTIAAPSDVPSSLELELDGKHVDAVATKPEPGRLVLTFAPTPATSARLVLTSAALTWWSIADLSGVCK